MHVTFYEPTPAPTQNTGLRLEHWLLLASAVALLHPGCREACQRVAGRVFPLLITISTKRQSHGKVVEMVMSSGKSRRLTAEN